MSDKSIDTLVFDIYALLEGKTLADPKVLEKFGPELGQVLSSRLGEGERKPTLRMSNLGKPLRQLWYELKGYKGEELSGKTLLKFTYGSLIESFVLVLAEAAGHKVERLQEEIEVDGVKGHIDAVIDGVLVDVKSCSSYSFKKFETKTLFQDDPFGYIGQLAGYAKAIELPACFIAVDKVSGDICLLEVPRERIEAYDVRGRIKTIREAVDKPDEPARCYVDEAEGKSGNRKLSIGCSYCSWKEHCWRDSNGGRGLQLYFYARGPVWLTTVAKEPKVFKEKQEEE